MVCSDRQRQLADAEDLIGKQRFEVGRMNGGNGDGFAKGVENLDGIAAVPPGGGMVRMPRVRPFGPVGGQVI